MTALPAVLALRPAYDAALLAGPAWWRAPSGVVALAVGLGILAALAERWRIQRLMTHQAELERRIEEAVRAVAEANQALLEKNAELERLNEIKTEFLGIAAHDIKNPLGVVLGLSEILVEQAEGMRKSAPDMAESLVQRASLMHHSAQHMANLVTQLLDTVALESGKVQLAQQPVALDEVAATVVQAHQLTALRKQISISLASHGDCSVQADPERVWEVFENLLTNAIKFSPAGRQIWVSVDECTDAGRRAVRFAVRDEGPGLTARDKERVFGRFQRLSARPTAGEHSTGLGLSIVKTLVEMHEGRLWVESEPGQGATFVAQFPAGVL
jgi:signal transduction histidine kinase